MWHKLNVVGLSLHGRRIFFFFWMIWNATHGTSFRLTQFSNNHFGVYMRGDRITFKISYHLWVREDSWFVTLQSICFIMQFSKQSFVHVGDTFQCIHMIFVILILMVNMLTSNNNMRTRHVHFLEFAIVTPFFIQPNREISNRPNLSRVNCLLD